MAQVKARYFAVLRERRGVEAEWIDLVDGESLANLYQRLFPPDARGALPVGFARNQRWAVPTEIPVDGDEVAFLPPLGGG